MHNLDLYKLNNSGLSTGFKQDLEVRDLIMW